MFTSNQTQHNRIIREFIFQENSSNLILENLDIADFLLTNESLLQVVHRHWQRNNFKGVINAIQKMFDHAIGIFGQLLWFILALSYVLHTLAGISGIC